MGILIAVVVMIGGVVGVSKKEGVFRHDTTVKDTIAFEKQAAKTALNFVTEVEGSHPEAPAE